MAESAAVTTTTEQPQPSRFSFTKILVGVTVLAGLVVLGRQAGAYLPQFTQWVNGLGVWGPLVFVVGYIVAAVAFVPGSLLTLAAGAIWGIFPGVLYVFIAAVLGASAAFLVARYVARTAIERRLAGNARFAAVDHAVGVQGRRLVFLLRLSPVFPFNLLNYALGLTSVRFVDYVIASIGMLPGTFLYVYYGKLAGDLAALAGGASVEKGTGYYLILTLGLLATVIVTTLVTRTARKALREATGEG
ncbi:MAG: TVP38/TMEM64 family protein [Deltaproteobacteria bacterium]|nr:TVP38/TMEM64 family protein [Deltaproteobacteria bacterium]